MSNKTQLPAAFLVRMQELLTNEYDEFIHSYDEPAYRALRLNPLKVKKDATASLLSEVYGYGMTNTDNKDIARVPWCDLGYYFGDDLRPGIHPYHAAGAYYIQEPSAMLPGELAHIAIDRAIAKRGFVRVLDMCAAPGGKSTHVAGYIGNKGILVANEPIPSRAKILSQNIERMGLTNTLVCREMPDKLASVFPGFFDVILTDVPCSGEGMFRKDEVAVSEWSEDNVEMCVKRGAEILDAAHRCLKPGGCIVYSTCTYEPAENENAVRVFISTHPGYAIAKTDINGIELLSLGTYRIWPHKHKGEGHFAAVLTTDEPDWTGETGTAASADADKRVTDYVFDKSISRDAQSLLKSFLTDTLTSAGTEVINGRIIAFGDNIYCVPEELAPYATATDKSRSLCIERPGLHIGTLKKGRIEPSHSLALALSTGMCQNEIMLSASDERVLKYLQGESIACDPSYKGYAVVYVDSYSLGWGKASGGVLKNHYPKGLRYHP
ncbi:MAG: RsmB/NOP family class I SAM-dependent RNA methyltransferase [Lachnospiraceae bacterium]|nr:RsmB/NOP family class I SAM-dependent RNA methyltransferase [Lachnospiraceae bacterium]